MQEGQDKTLHFSVMCVGKCCLHFQGFLDTGEPQRDKHPSFNPFCSSLCHYYLVGQITSPGAWGSHLLGWKMCIPQFALPKLTGQLEPRISRVLIQLQFHFWWQNHTHKENLWCPGLRSEFTEALTICTSDALILSSTSEAQASDVEQLKLKHTEVETNFKNAAISKLTECKKKN